ncbi:tlr0585 [Thermosynechococcus vestitus BP-1]|uniref:Tlr0585 protein n=2 Tax=Thermosynechococcus vestitus TaxID=146786 RepID=Q8DLB1_THEVB|nr:tlr0585 [Thermosynechococcus vestitus BP-1]
MGTPLTPMTRHYILRLLNQGSDPLAWLEQNLAKAAQHQEQDILSRLESLAPSELAAVEMIVRLHRSLSRTAAGNLDASVQLKSLEQKLFHILGVTPPPEGAPSGMTAASAAQAPLQLAQLLGHLNRVSKVAQKYLGSRIVANYWRASRPPSSWCADFLVSDDGSITYHGPLPPQEVLVNSSQQQQLETWLVSFVDQCHRILPLFRQDLQKARLSDSSLGPDAEITAVADKR